MSIRGLRWAKAEVAARNDPKSARYSPLTPAESFVLVMLGDHFNDDWARAWPSQSTLAIETGFSVKTITRAVDGLRAHGLVVTEEWVLNDGAYRMPYRYLLPLWRPDAHLAKELPVLAFVWADAAGDFGHESMARVPGSNLIVEREFFDVHLP